jgi:hypothetical protein
VVAAAMVVLTGAVQAALVSSADGTLKDTTTKLIWRQNGYANGGKLWGAQMAWAATALLRKRLPADAAGQAGSEPGHGTAIEIRNSTGEAACS